jgi:hypothetical protein
MKSALRIQNKTSMSSREKLERFSGVSTFARVLFLLQMGITIIDNPL